MAQPLFIFETEHCKSIEKRTDKWCRETWYNRFAQCIFNDLTASLINCAKYSNTKNAQFLRAIIEYKKVHNNETCDEFWRFYIRAKR